jgi:hypothetical protein
VKYDEGMTKKGYLELPVFEKLAVLSSIWEKQKKITTKIRGDLRVYFFIWLGLFAFGSLKTPTGDCPVGS